MSLQTTDSAQEDEQLMALLAVKARHPYMFVEPHHGQDFYRGWIADLIVACDAIDHLLGNDKKGFHFCQIKEKFGSARYYWSTDHVKPTRLSLTINKGVFERQFGLENANEVEQQISQILMAIENSSRRKCIVCSEPAEARLFGGWLLITCDQHGPNAISRDVLFHTAYLRESFSERD